MGVVAGRREDDATAIVVQVLQAHASSLLGLARRHSLCADDAHDAYQRATEIFLRRAPSLDPETRVSWLRTVVKHEAMAVRAERQRHVSTADPELDLHETGDPDAEERVARFDRLAHAAEALERLKPQEVRALLLKAEGHSYQEICDITGWTYTKVNRCLTEGRRAFRRRFADIESGEECERWGPVLSLMADGEASAGDVAAARRHLRGCPSCRAALREFREAPRAVAALVPAAALAGPAVAVASGQSRLPGVSAVFGRVHEFIASASPVKVQAAVDGASGGKVAIVAASTVALAGGGLAAVDQRVRDALLPPRAAKVERARTDTRPPKQPAPVVGPERPVVDHAAAQRAIAEAAKPKPRTAAPPTPVTPVTAASAPTAASPTPTTATRPSGPPAEFSAPSRPQATATTQRGGEFSAAAPQRSAPTAARSSGGGSSSGPAEFGP